MRLSNEEIIKINTERIKELKKPYNPITGEGSDCCPRLRFYCEDIVEKPISLPIWCFNDKVIDNMNKAKSLRKYFADRGVEYNDDNVSEAREVFHNHRIIDDIEYWFATDVQILDLLSEQYVPFILNPAQRAILKEMLDDWYNGRPLLYVITKGRQNGFSTLIQMFFGHKQIIVYRNVNSIICAHVENTTRVIRGMYTQMIRRIPLEHTPTGERLNFNPFEGSPKTRVIKETNSRISIGSAEHPDTLVGDKISLVHFSEVGLYKSTDGKTPEALVQSIESGVQLKAHTAIFKESTARGVGNYFHKEYMRAMRGESGYKAFFFAWFRNAAYMLPIKHYNKFINTLTREEYSIFKAGATLEGIAWRREKIKQYAERWRFKQDFPSFIDDAFNSTGSCFYDVDDIDRLERGVKNPIDIGEYVGEADTGERSMAELQFRSMQNGNLKIWNFPDKTRYANRYVVVVDIGGTKDRGDLSVICVIDRKNMMHNGVPEVVAEWAGNCDYDILAWKAVQIATAYQEALLIIESNTMEKNGVRGGDNFESIMDEIAYYYPNLYSRTSPEKVREGLPQKYGFHTNVSSKRMVCNHQYKMLREDGYIERCQEAVDEHRTFEIDKNGKLNAREGCHDDRHITRAIGCWAAYNEMPNCRLRTPMPSKHKSVLKKKGISSI